MRLMHIPVFFLFLIFMGSGNAKDVITTKISVSEGVSLIFEESPFNMSQDKPTDCGGGFICLINNQPLWGADGKLPETKLSKAMVDIKGVQIELDTQGMYDPLISSERKSHYQVLHYYGDSWKVRVRFSDGAGAYYAEWLVNKTGSIRVIMGDSELLYDAFDHIFGDKIK